MHESEKSIPCKLEPKKFDSVRLHSEKLSLLNFTEVKLESSNLQLIKSVLRIKDKLKLA